MKTSALKTLTFIALMMALTTQTALAALVHTFNDPTVTSGDQFGFSVAISGNNVLVGAIGDDTNGNSVGQAHLFDAVTGNLLQTFNDPTVTGFDFFGNSVSISGNNVLIGAQRDNTNGSRVGQAHLFDALTGNILHTFDDPTPSFEGNFGGSVAVSGNNVLIGDSNDDTNGNGEGQAHLFDSATGNLLQTFNNPDPSPSPTSPGAFGRSVAINSDYVLIGASTNEINGDNVGQAYLFDTASGNLLQTFNDPTPTLLGQFGVSVSISGNNVLIGAMGNGSSLGQAHLFDAATGNLLQTFNDPTVTGFDLFGNSVSISGNNVLIGAFFDSTNGSAMGQAHLFDAATGNLLQTFNDPTPTGGDLFGNSVSISGNNVLIGAIGDDTNGDGVGQAHLYSIVPEPSAFVLILLGYGITVTRRF